MNSGYGFTALYQATVSCQPQALAWLLRSGANVHAREPLTQASALFHACTAGTSQVLELLIRGGADVNECDNAGCPPLVNLVINGNGDARSRLAVLLSQDELDLEARFMGCTATEWARQRRRVPFAHDIDECAARRSRWSCVRSAWVGAVVRSTRRWSLVFTHAQSPQ